MYISPTMMSTKFICI